MFHHFQTIGRKNPPWSENMLKRVQQRVFYGQAVHFQHTLLHSLQHEFQTTYMKIDDGFRFNVASTNEGHLRQNGILISYDLKRSVRIPGLRFNTKLACKTRSCL